jgi:AmmeMemoRadiSam system protein B
MLVAESAKHGRIGNLLFGWMSNSLLLLALASSAGSFAAASADERPISAMFPERQHFIQALGKERPDAVHPIEVTGISVPHHLLAADLIARGFWAAAGNRYERVIVISPDHFNRSQRPFASTQKDIDTAFGPLRNDRAATASLLADGQLFDESDLFAQEHGIAALLPFVKYFFPDAGIVPVVVSYGSTRADWERAVAALDKLAGPGTLIVQSTDYSHYLPHAAAQRRDQETLNIISAEDVDGIARLVQPDHMDSKGSQYIQMQLQAGTKGARGTVIANRSSTEYSAIGTKTTSYIVTIYTTDPRAATYLRYDDHEIVYFGGDVFIGRWLTQPLADPDVAQHIVEEIRSVTHGSPMIVNLEGLLLNDPPPGLNPDLHVMYSGLALPILKALNVKVAGYANNHSHDLGANGVKESVAILNRAGIVPLGHMQTGSVGRLGLVAVNFVGARDYKGYPVIRQASELERLCRMEVRSPLVAFVHWGEEYMRVARPADLAAAETMHGCGVNAVIGAHSHQAATRIEAMQGGEYQTTFSLGNMLFDQKGERASSALLELRLFKQGTFATRLVQLPNLFDRATEWLADKARQAGETPAAETEDLPRRPTKLPCVGRGC